MTWTKLSDDFGDDCWTLSDAAFRLHVEGLTWSNRKLLDLCIPKEDLRRFAKNPAAVVELLAAGWWSDGSEVFIIRHHAQYQRKREDVLKQQEANASNGRKGGRPPKPREQAVDHRAPKTHSLSDSQTEMDRPGPGLEGKDGTDNELNGWPEVRPPGSGLPPVTASLIDQNW